MNFLNSHIKKLATSWLALNILAFICIFYVRPPTFEGDILELISEKSSDPKSNIPLYLSKELLSKHSKEIKFGVEGENKNTLKLLKKEIKDKFFELEEIQYIERAEIENLISNAWPYSFQDEDLKRLEGGDINLITSRIKELLSGADGYLHAQLLKFDPLLIMSTKIKPFLKEFSQRNKTLIFKLREREDEKIFLQKISTFISDFESRHQGSKIHWSSYIRFKNSSANKIETDIKFVSTFSSILIPLSLIFYFGSFGAPLLSFIASLSGILLGTIFVIATKDSIHLITMAFGSSLVGASVDYAIHYQAEAITNSDKSQNELRKMVTPSLVMGALTSILSFVGLYLTSFPGLKELALFSIGSLIASLVSTILWYPYLSYVRAKAKQTLVVNKKNRNRKTITAVLAIFLFLGGLLFDSSKDFFQDDIGALQTPDKNLVQEEIWFRDSEQSKEYSSFLFLTRSPESRKLTEELLEAGKELNIEPFSILPKKEEAEKSKVTYLKFLEKNSDKLKQELKRLSYDETLLNNALKISPRDYLESIEPIVSKFKITDEYGFLPTSKTESEVKSILEKNKINAEFYNQRENISKAFKNFRIESTKLVSLSYAIILLLLVFKYGLRNGMISLIPSLLSVFSTLLFLNILSISLSFFGILAFVIVLGLSIDYSVFHLENTEQQEGANLSIFLATLTTIITFGALASSSTESLRNFGIVISLGVFFTAIYTYILFNKSEQ